MIDHGLRLETRAASLPRQLRFVDEPIVPLVAELADFVMVVAALECAEYLDAFRIHERAVRFVAGSEDDVERMQREAVDVRLAFQQHRRVRSGMHMSRLGQSLRVIDEPHA